MKLAKLTLHVFMPCHGTSPEACIPDARHLMLVLKKVPRPFLLVFGRSEVKARPGLVHGGGAPADHDGDDDDDGLMESPTSYFHPLH